MNLGITPLENPQDNDLTYDNTILPGSSIIGHGYDIYDRYCRGESLRRQLFDLGEFKTHPASKLETHENITVTPLEEGDGDKIIGSTLSEYTKKFSSKVGLEGSYGAFEGDIEVAFETKESNKTSTRFVSYDYRLYKWKLDLPTEFHIAKLLTDDATRDLLKADVATLLDDYGTHYLATIIVGGRLNYSFTANSTEFESQQELVATANMSYELLIGSISGSVEAEKQEQLRTFNQNSHARVTLVGGGDGLINKITNGEEGAFQSWCDSVSDNQAFAGMGKDSLVRISALIDDPKRKEEVDQAIDNLEKAHPLPDSPIISPVLAYHHITKVKGKSRSRWFYTTDDQEQPPSQFGPKGVPFYAYNEAVEGTVPIYRFSASNPDRYMLSTDETERSGWKKPTCIFYAYRNDNGDGSREKINAFTSNHFNSTGGWHYTKGTNIGGWTHNASNDFFVPKMK